MEEQSFLPSHEQASFGLSQDKADTLMESIEQWVSTGFTRDQFSDLVEAAKSDDIMRRHYGMIGLRYLTSTVNPPIQEIIDTEMVPRIVKFMHNDEAPRLQMEATWIIANFRTGTPSQVQTFIDLDGVYCLVKLLKSKVKTTQENAMWALGNIAADNDRFRDNIFRHWGLEEIVRLIKANVDPKITAIALNGLKNLSLALSQATFDKFKPAIPVLFEIITQNIDDGILTEAIVTLARLVGLSSPIINYPSILERLQEKIKDSDVLVPKILQLICDSNTDLRDKDDLCFFLLCLMGNYPTQADKLINNPHFMDMLIKLVITSRGYGRLVARILDVLIQKSDSARVSHLVDLGVLDCFIALLGSTDVVTLVVALEGIDNILFKGSDILSGENQFLDILENRNGVAKIEKLQSHSDSKVYAMALNILEEYFSV